MTVLTIGTLGLTGCSQGNPTGAAPTARTAPVQAAEQAKGAAEAAAPQVPDQVCDGVETLFSEMRSQSVRWDPAQQPFDPVMAAAVRNLAQGLAVKGREPTSEAVSVQVASTVKALNRLGIAMAGGKDSTRVLAALGRMMAAYSALAAACDPDSKPSREPTVPTPTSTTAAAASTAKQLGPTCQKVQGVMDTVGVNLAAWSPETNPFDKSTAAEWRNFGDQLAALAPQGGNARIRTAIMGNASAFTGIADAMRSRDREGIDRALRRAGQAFRDIHSECSLS